MVVISSSSKPNTIKMDEALKKTRIQEIFQTMDYGGNFENLDKAIDWILSKSRTLSAYVENTKESPNGIATNIANRIDDEVFCTVHVPEIDTIKTILSKWDGKVKWSDTKPTTRARILKKLAEEIEKNADVLSQIEILCRGILSKDTKNKAVPLLAQYFYYNSMLAISYSQQKANWKPEGIAAGIISDSNALSSVGLILAPALAAGYNIVLQVGTQLTPVVLFILELAKKVGIPEDIIRLIPSDDGELLPYLSSESVTILSVLADLHDGKYLGINSYNKKILNLASYKTPLIVFDDADLESASTSVLEAAWSYQGLLPWSVDTVLVQENVFAIFVTKLKVKLGNARVGKSHDKMVDFSVLSGKPIEELNSLIAQAKSLGIEVFQPPHGLPLFIGAKVHANRVLKAGAGQHANGVTVLPFRTIDEGVNLANNTRQGLAATIWSENIGIVNEVTRKLNVSNVWINTFGQISADVTLSPIKDSGAGYFGGKEGFYEYVQFKKTPEACNSVDLPSKLNNAVVVAINNAKKSQTKWVKVSRIDKARLLQSCAEYVDSNRKNFGLNLSELWLENWINTIYATIIASQGQNSSTQPGFNVTSSREPRGVIAIETKNVDSHNAKLIISGLFEGNSVILLNESEPTQGFYKELSQRFPSGVLTILPYSLENIATAAGHKGLSVYLGHGANPVFPILPVNESKIFKNVANDEADSYFRVTFCKNVWSNVGKSSNCNL